MIHLHEYLMMKLAVAVNASLKAMKRNKRLGLLTGVCSVVLQPVTANAFTLPGLQNVELSIAAGPTWNDASNSYVQSTPIETDLNHVDTVTKSTSYQVGIGYHFFQAQLANRQFFNDFLVQLNAIHNTATIKGMVWAAGTPLVQNQSFKAPYTSTRLMIDIKPALFTYAQTAFYPIMGLGIAWNRMSYSQEQSDSDWGTIDAGAATSKNIAYDLGFGFRSKISQNVSASLEYVSTHLGRMTPSDYSTGTQEMLSPPSFPVRSESVLLGLSWRF